MPYIKEEDKLDIYEYNILDTSNITTPGKLNFAITQIVLDYFEKVPPNYQSINDILGALEGAKLEFYRRVAVPYEDKKKEENGDVY